MKWRHLLKRESRKTKSKVKSQKSKIKNQKTNSYSFVVLYSFRNPNSAIRNSYDYSLDCSRPRTHAHCRFSDTLPRIELGPSQWWVGGGAHDSQPSSRYPRLLILGAAGVSCCADAVPWCREPDGGHDDRRADGPVGTHHAASRYFDAR